jgi:hypothetical protein
MRTASRGHRAVLVVLALCIGLVAPTPATRASTIPCQGDCAGDEQVTIDDPTVGWINGETYEVRINRAAVAADNQRHVKFVPAEK